MIHKNLKTLVDLCLVDSKVIDEQQVYVLKTPCRFVFSESMVTNLKDKYLPHEEIGGLLWAKPSITNGERVCSVEKVTYLRNVIEDKPRKDNLKKSGAYLADTNELHRELSNIFEQGYLPVKFHTHPTVDSNGIGSISKQMWQAETSNQDRIESKISFILGGARVLTPRVLIIGNEFKSSDIIIGIYDGGIAPVDIKRSIEKVQSQNIQIASDKMSEIEFSDQQKIVIAILLLVVIFVIIKYPKAGLGVLLVGGMAAQPLLSRTQHLGEANYYSKLDGGEARILIP